jgi:signal transduction histidine kinase
VRNSLKLLHTSTFRLAALYLFVFAISVGALLAYIYYNTAGLLERQTDETIQAEVQALADQYFQRGLSGVLQTVRSRSASETGAVYLLIDEDGDRIAGNLDAMPASAIRRQSTGNDNWIEFPFAVKGQNGMQIHQARAYHAELAAGFHLVVGRDVEELRQFRSIIQRTLVWSILIALVLGLGGGLLMSRNFLHRVDAITGASRSIMAGDLSGRMPVSGTGDELDRLAVSLNEMLSQIERLMAGMKEVSSNVAHDLRTPLTRLKARVESALRSGEPVEHRAALEKTIEESDRLLQTFNSLLSIARAEAGQSAEGLQLTDAKPIIEDVAELYEPMAEEQGGSLRTEVSEKLPVRADRQLLAQAINNLLDNALKYGAIDGGGPAIVVSGAAENGKVVISVADRGGGIAEKDRRRVVERFVRLEESRSKPGSGLGLSLVQGVMKLHGGEFVLEDNGPGLKAKLILPRQEASV